MQFPFGMSVPDGIAEQLYKKYCLLNPQTKSKDEMLRRAQASDIAKILADLAGLPYVPAKEIRFQEELIRPYTNEKLEALRGLPLFRTGTKVTLGLFCPGSSTIEDEWRSKHPDDEVAIVYISFSDYNTFLSSRAETMSLTGKLDESVLGKAQVEQVFDTDTEKDSKDAIPQLLSMLLRDGIKTQASDILIFRGPGEYYTQKRVHGSYTPRRELLAQIAEPLDRFLLRLVKIDDHRARKEPTDAQFVCRCDGLLQEVRYSRDNVDQEGFHIALRYVGGQREHWVLGRGRLAMPDSNHEAILRMANSPDGLFLLSGPTGSGKSTTLLSILREINRPNINILTIEDPVEFRIPGLKQSSLLKKDSDEKVVELMKRLKAKLRQDPNVIVMPEMRDPDIARLGVGAALTGHLVVSTMHARTAASTVTRLIEMGTPLEFLGDTLLGIINQRLVQILCTHCAEEETVTSQQVRFYGLDTEWEGRKVKVRHPKGCPHCHETGIQDRRAVLEVLPMRQEILVDNSLGSLSKRLTLYGNQLGLPSMKKQVLEMVDRKEIDLRSANEAAGLTCV